LENDLKQLPAAVFAIPALRRLDVAYNKVT
jgi:hypothetical protein